MNPTLLGTSLALGALAACGSTRHAIADEPVRDPGEGVGVVYGSFVVLVGEDGEGGEGGGSVDAGGREYRLEVHVGGTELVSPEVYYLDAPSDVETFFALDLPAPRGAAEYGLVLRCLGWRELEASLSTRIPVLEGELSYVGRIAVHLPRRIGGWNAPPFSVEVEEREEEAAAWLDRSHPGLRATRVTHLAQHDAASFRGSFRPVHDPPDVPSVP